MKKFITFLIFLFLSLNITYSKENINIAYTIDNNYPVYTLISINSIIMNGSKDTNYKFYIVEDNITDENKDFMRNYVEERGQNIEFIHINPDTVTKGHEVYTWLPPIAIVRIVLPEILPANMHKILYIDGDTIVTGNIKELYDTDLGDYYAGMIRDIKAEEIQITKNMTGTYHNSGVILMDLDKWRKSKVSRQMVSYLHKNLKKLLQEHWADQDVINIVLDKKIKTLPDNWNNQTTFKGNLSDSKVPGILHYIQLKPWKTMRNVDFTPEYKLYYKYWDKSRLKKYKYRDIARYLKKRFFTTHIGEYLSTVKKYKTFPADWAELTIYNFFE